MEESIEFRACGFRGLETNTVIGKMAAGRQAGTVLKLELRAHILIYKPDTEREPTRNAVNLSGTLKPSSALPTRPHLLILHKHLCGPFSLNTAWQPLCLH